MKRIVTVLSIAVMHWPNYLVIMQKFTLVYATISRFYCHWLSTQERPMRKYSDCAIVINTMEWCSFIMIMLDLTW